MLFCYLGLYTWNARTGYLDTVAERSGLEIVGYVLTPVTWVRDSVVHSWNSYLALIDVAEENKRLRAEVSRLEQALHREAENTAELVRLRAFFDLQAVAESPGFGARVIAARFGPQAVMQTLTINKGFAHGAVAGTPVVAAAGVVGRVQRSAAHASTVLLLTDPAFRLPVISQESRTTGILAGAPGEAGALEVSHVSQSARIAEGELLITAGTDGVFPKGIPVGLVTRVEPGNEILFQRVQASPLVSLDRLEEVVLLRPRETATSHGPAAGSETF